MTEKKTPAIERKAHKLALDEFRNKHFGQLENNINTLISIRDKEHKIELSCPHCKKKSEVDFANPTVTKNRIEAIKAIARHLAGLQPEKENSATANVVTTQAQKMEAKLSAAEEKELQAQLDA